MSWLERLIPKALSSSSKKGVPEGLWTNCSQCKSVLYRAELEKMLMICPKCGNHARLSARQRLHYFLDEEDRQELAKNIVSKDVLNFRDTKRYRDRLSAAQKKTHEKDALLVMRGSVESIPVVASAFDFNFLGGSMGAALGERFVQGVHTCLEHHLPLVNFSASGGARMQEALISLMQMAKTSAALAKLGEKGLPFISVLTDPTMGGVSASLAMLGDVIIAEPNSLIGFAGPRVIKQTVRQTLPEGFQRSEFLLEHGAIDMIVERHQLRTTIASLLAKLTQQSMPA